MKKIKLILSVVFAGLMTLSCYDDTAVWESINDHEERIKNLETLCTNLNSEIVTLKATIDAIEAGDGVIDVVPLMENGVEVGYAITFAEKGTINIYHGRNGSDGAAGSDGKDGADGKDGMTPSVGVSKDTDGKYYWTVNGEWLLDEEGNKIPTTGADGKDGEDGAPGADGVTPQFKVEDGAWYVSCDNGLNWIKVGVSAGTSDSSSIFSKVSYDDEYVYFTLVDGTLLTIERTSGFDIVFPDGEEFAFSYGESFDVAYKVIGGTSNTVVKAFASYGWRVKVIKTDEESGFIKVTAPWDMEDGEVVVLLSDGKGNTLIRTLSFVGGELYILSSSFEVGAEASTVEVPLSTNLEYEVVSDVDWITVVPSTKVEMRDETVVLQVAENTSHLSRSAVLSIINPAGLIITQFAVFQHAHSVDAWYLVGEFNQWNSGEESYRLDKEDEWFVLRDFVTTGGGLKFNVGSWEMQRTGVFAGANKAMYVWDGGDNIIVPAGTYDVYMDHDAVIVYFMTPGLKPGETPAGDFATLVWDAAVPFGNGQDRNMTMDSEYVYVAQAAGGKGAIKAISIENPNIVKDVKVTTYTPAGLTNGTHAVSCVRMLPNTDPAVNGGKDVLVASNLTLGYGSEKLIFYVWSNGIDADPNYFVIDSGIRRLGDKFTVKGTYQEGEFILFDVSSGNTVIRVTVKNGVAGLWGTPELAYATGRFTMPLSGAYSIGECTIHPDATFDGDGNPTAALLTTNAVNGFFTQKEGNAYELAAWGTDPELTHTYGYNFFEHNGKDYIAYVKVAGDIKSAALNIIEDINGATDFKGTLEAQTGLFTAPVNGTGNASHSIGDCATAVVDGVRYIAVMGQNIGISLYKLN